MTRKKGTTLEELRRKRDERGARISPKDAQALVETIQEMRQRERGRTRKARRATGS